MLRQAPYRPDPRPPHTQAADWAMTARNQLERARDAVKADGAAVAAIEHTMAVVKELEAALRQIGEKPCPPPP